MSVANCPKCSQQLDLSSVQAGSVIQCPCGARLRTPKVKGTPQSGVAPSQLPPSQQNPVSVDPLAANPSISNDPLGLGNLPAGQFPPAQPSPGLGPSENPQFGQPFPSSVDTGGAHPNPTQQPTQPYLPSTSYAQPNTQQSSASLSSGLNLSHRQQLAFVNLGTQLVFYGVVAHIGAAVVGLLLIFIPIPLLGSIVAFAALGGKIAVIVGYIFSLYAPKETDSKKYLIGALAVIGLGGVIPEIISMVMRFASFAVGIKIFLWLGTIASVLPMISVAIYLFFLKAMADYTKQSSAAEEAVRLALILLAIAGVQLLIPIFLRSLGIWFEIFLGIVILIAYICWLVTFLQFLGNLEFRKRERSTGSSNAKSGWGANR